MIQDKEEEHSKEIAKNQAEYEKLARETVQKLKEQLDKTLDAKEQPLLKHHVETLK